MNFVVYISKTVFIFKFIKIFISKNFNWWDHVKDLKNIVKNKRFLVSKNLILNDKLLHLRA